MFMISSGAPAALLLLMAAKNTASALLRILPKISLRWRNLTRRAKVMIEPKYRCPNCGCKRLYYARETLTKKIHKLNPDGTPYKDYLCTINNYSDTVEEYIECQNCNDGVNLSDGVELMKWENPHYVTCSEAKV
jgi:DNA-directed RNA polymerase subunit RPC12/RpoP